MNDFLRGNDPKWRCLRTILQGVIGVLVAQLPGLLTGTPMPPEWQAFTVAIVMAVLSPVMAMLGGDGDA